jgi:hypothetical protein
MMRTALFAGLVLLFCLPAHAQTHTVPAGATPSNISNSSGGGGGGTGGSGGGSGFATSSIRPLPTRAAFQPHLDYAHGSDDFSPSTFLPYQDAVKLGESVLNEQPKSLGAVAAQYRAMKKESHSASAR